MIAFFESRIEKRKKRTRVVFFLFVLLFVCSSRAQFQGFSQKMDENTLKILSQQIAKSYSYEPSRFLLARYLESNFECEGRKLLIVTHADLLNTTPDPDVAPHCEEKGCKVEIFAYEEGSPLRVLFQSSLIDFKGLFEPFQIKVAGSPPLNCPDLEVSLHGSYKKANAPNQYIRGRLVFRSGRYELKPEPLIPSSN